MICAGHHGDCATNEKRRHADPDIRPQEASFPERDGAGSGLRCRLNGRRAPGAVAGDDDRRRPDTPQYIGRFKGPTLCALAPRAPYFHNGFAASLDEVVAFYNTRFSIGFTVPEQRDLVAFLNAL